MMTTDDSMTFVVPVDLHLTEPGLDNDKVASWMVDEVNDLIRPDFVQFIGDNVQDATGHPSARGRRRNREVIPGLFLKAYFPSG